MVKQWNAFIASPNANLNTRSQATHDVGLRLDLIVERGRVVRGLLLAPHQLVQCLGHLGLAFAGRPADARRQNGDVYLTRARVHRRLLQCLHLQPAQICPNMVKCGR